MFTFTGGILSDLMLYWLVPAIVPRRMRGLSIRKLPGPKMTDYDVTLRLIAEAAVRRRPPSRPPDWLPYRHQNGALYELMTFAMADASGTEMAVYRSVENGKVWTCPRDEFSRHFRFEPIERSEAVTLRRRRRVTR